jgi:DNA replication and repair protein RecF
VAEPLVVQALQARGFRNLAPLSLACGPRFNVLFGDNGQGKSSVLEALRYLSALESFRGAKVDDLVQVGQDRSELHLVLQKRPLPHTLSVTLSRHAPRQLSLDGKRPQSSLSWLAVAKTVLFHPGDLVLAQGGPEGRRTLLDRVLTEMDPTYGQILGDYLRALRSRNRLLKAETPSRPAIVAFDPLLADAGATIVKARGEMVRALAPHAQRAFARIVGDDVPVSIRYRPRATGDAAALRALLAASLEKDLLRGFTAEGPHADDVELGVKAGSAKHHASQGQQRALVLALKLAELSTLSERTSEIPVLILDDVGSELDAERTRRFFSLLSELGGQVFLTTTRRDLIRVEGERVDLEVTGGVVRAA